MKIFRISTFIVLLVTLFFSCQKEFSIEGVTTAAGTWQFNDDTKLYAGNIDSAYIETTGTTKTLNLIGKSSDGLQNFVLHLYATDSFTVGSYKASLFQSDFQYYSQSKTIYESDQFIGEFIVTITALSNNTITGIFAGASEDSAKNIKPLSQGKFTSRINLFGNGSGSGGAGSATGTLGANAGICTPVSTAGVFTQGIALSSTNTVSVQINVSGTGSYTISTNNINGVSFSATGTFTAPGLQTVILKGTGTPVNSGNQNFAVTFGNSSCNFSINFAAGVPPAIDYFPTTAGSFWRYGNINADPKDSFLITATSRTKLVGAVTYNVFTYDAIPSSGSPEELYYRKSSGIYYEYFDAESFFSFNAGTTNPKNIEYIFLKESANVNDTFASPKVTGTTSINNSPTAVTVYIKTTIVAKATSVIIGSVTFQDIIKVKYEYIASWTGMPPFVFTIEERWFAKGIGLIYNSFNDGTTKDNYNIGQYKVF